jgi:FKBP-type peptidyl-prolyl cis-trans isomerase SlyD
MQIQDNSVVSFDYTLKSDAGELIDSSEGHEPLTYLHGVGQIVLGLEQAMAGQQPGDELSVTVEPDQAYGQHDPQLVQPIPRDRFEGIDRIEPGMQFTAQTEAGPRTVTVTEVADDQVTIDANHPLAGQTLHFDVTVRDVREATDEELEHGHAP